LPKLAIRHLREHRKRQTAQCLRPGEAWREHRLVSASTIGTPIEPPNINRRWDELRQRAGPDGLRLHDLRPGCATFMLAAGMPSRAIMEVPGHSGISVTMNTYAHVLPPYFVRKRPTRSMNCSGHNDGPFGGYCGRCKIAMGLR
jgi:integrase